MGLIARQIEADGIPTVSMTSALSITQSVNPPRAVFLDFPLGHTTGKANQPDLQHDIVTQALLAFSDLENLGQIKSLSHSWAADDSWKQEVLRTGEGRIERVATPQYQTQKDQRIAEQRGVCETCVFPEATTG